MSSKVSSAPSPLQDSVSPIVWGNSPVPKRSSPIAIARSREESDDDDDSDVAQSFHQLVLEKNSGDPSSTSSISQFQVGSLPTASSSRRRLQSRGRDSQQQPLLGASLPAAPLLQSRRTSRQNPSMSPIALTEQQQASMIATSAVHNPTPSYGSLRESQLAGRFLDGPCSYRDARSGQIKPRVDRFQNQQSSSSPMDETTSSLGERIQQAQQQQAQSQEATPTTSTLSNMMNSTTVQQGLAQSFADQDQALCLENDKYLSTSLTGLELLQRGLAVADLKLSPSTSTIPEATNVSSQNSSYTTPNNYDGTTSGAALTTFQDGVGHHHHEEAQEYDDDDHVEGHHHDDEDIFDLDME